jgi:uncharacterized membrane protein
MVERKLLKMTPKLIEILKIVNEWLKFAEAKNGILLAFSGAGITAILTFISASNKFPNSLLIGLVISIILLCLCSLICALSFLPRTNLEHIVWLQGKPSRSVRYSKKDSDNLYYFGHLLKYKDNEILDALNRLYFDNQISLPYKKEDLDIAGQIVINSEITFLKVKFFVVSLWLLIASIIIIPIPVVANLISLILKNK